MKTNLELIIAKLHDYNFVDPLEFYFLFESR